MKELEKVELITLIKTTSTCKCDTSTDCFKESTQFWTTDGELLFTNERLQDSGQKAMTNPLSKN